MFPAEPSPQRAQQLSRPGTCSDNHLHRTVVPGLGANAPAAGIPCQALHSIADEPHAARLQMLCNDCGVALRLPDPQLIGQVVAGLIDRPERRLQRSDLFARDMPGVEPMLFFRAQPALSFSRLA